MKLNIVDTTGKDTGKTVDLSDAVFGVEPSDHAIYLDVKQHQANLRQGTHKSKERGEVAGSRRKIKKQKGTGTARAGDIKNPIFRGGGRVFGPRPRDYGFKVNKKVKQLARKSALSYKAKSATIVVLKDFDLAKPQTKELATVLQSLGLTGKKTLLVLGETNRNIFLSGRNLTGTKITAANRLNTYDIINAQTLVLAESSVGVITEQFA